MAILNFSVTEFCQAQTAESHFKGSDGMLPRMAKKLHFRRPENVGRRLTLTRLALGFLNQKDFYTATRLGASAYSMWESGDSFPRVEHMMLLCQEFGLTLDWIYRGDLSGLPYGLATKIRMEAAKDSDLAEALDFSTIEIAP